MISFRIDWFHLLAMHLVLSSKLIQRRDKKCFPLKDLSLFFGSSQDHSHPQTHMHNADGTALLAFLRLDREKPHKSDGPPPGSCNSRLLTDYMAVSAHLLVKPKSSASCSE